MALDLVNFENKALKAVRIFWNSREAAKQKQVKTGKVDQGERAGVTGGKNMDGFINIILDVVKANGLSNANIHLQQAVLTLPGYFRPTKLWDILVIHKGVLIAAIEFKSHVGPSFGNNFNNRAEEAIGTAHDFWTAYREKAFGEGPPPFLGWMIMVEDAPKSRSPVRNASPHFQVFADFKDASYIKRYDLLCQKLVQEKLYAAATLITAPRSSAETGDYSEISSMSGLKPLITGLAGHVAAESARLAKAKAVPDPSNYNLE